MNTKPSPKITALSWGQIEIEGFSGMFKDAKLYPGGAREWDWSETGTRHTPGIQFADVEELLGHGATAVVLATGMHERLQVCPETIELLEARKIAVYVQQTKEAVRLYNQLRESVAVAALIHSTC